MNFKCKSIDISHLNRSCPIIAIFEDGEMTTSAKAVDKLLTGKLQALHKEGTFKGKLGQSFLLSTQVKKMPYVLLLGAGSKDRLTPQVFKNMIRLAITTLKASNISQVTNYLSELAVPDHDSAWKVQIIVQTTYESLYQFDVFKSEKEPTFTFKEYFIHVTEKQLKASEKALKQGLAISKAIVLTKNLANTPSNICTPTFLADQAKSLKRSFSRLKVNILNEKDMHKLGMNALLGVSQGSAEEAKLICVHHEGAGKKVKPIVFIGKGVTFDTGGNSLKPADSMVGMKYDMAGGATVLGIMQAVAELNLPLNVIGIIPAVENMPGGSAYKPEDILTSMSGQTIEVISTDAEGRLALCDAMTYSERFNPEIVIDIATLTGAVIIALGVHATGLVANDQTLADDLLHAGIKSADRAWQLPLWEEYQDQLRSPFADMANVGGRPAGTITAGCFLARFAKKFKWAHLDVAGTAALMSGVSERKATGRPVPMLMQYLLNRINKT